MVELRQVWRQWAATSWYATATTILAVVAGLLGSVYGGEIGSSFPFSWGPYSGVSYKAVAFWTTLVLFGILFFERQRHDDEAREHLQKTSSTIQSLIETLPPKAFRSQFVQQSETFHRALSSVIPRHVASGVTPEKLGEFIRALLGGIATLAFAYDDQPSGESKSAIYSANVMLFVKPNVTSEPFDATVSKALRFVAPDTDLRQLRGVLLLRQDLSVNASVDGVRPESAVPAIALPVPVTVRRGSRLALLPGAPNAFAGELEVDGYSDSRTLHQWCAEKGDFAPSVQEQIKTYFDGGDGKQICSFISRRLVSDRGEPIGVLNLHADRTNILGPAVERREVFQAMLTPFFTELSHAVSILITMEAETD
jgi:hypothetical protein